MDQAKLKLHTPAALTVPVRDARLLMDASDGDGALLYLYMLDRGGALDVDRAAHALRLSPQAVREAARRLERMGLLAVDEQALPAEELPEYQAEDLVRRSRTDPDFVALADETQATLGRVLSSTELKTLFSIYDDLALPAAVIMLLIHHCQEVNDERYGPSRRLGFAAIRREATVWFNKELVTVELAEEYLAELEKRRSLMGQALQALGIRGRDPVPTERKYIDAWLDMGFGPDALAIAADRTVTNTGSLSWKYMNAIVKSWHAKGLHTAAQIEAGDGPKNGERRQAASSAPDAGELERMKKLRERLKNS